MFFRIYQHLLPHARSFSLVVEKCLRQFFEGLVDLPADVKEYFDLIWFDIFPQDTRCLDEWEDQWGLPDNGLTTQERRDRLDATWQANGGQSPRYLQDTLQAAGFPVYVHEWWDPASEPVVGVKTCVTPRDPNAVVGLELLVNKITIVRPKYITGCGEAVMECGEASAICGNFTDLEFTEYSYEIPTDPDYWAYFVYIGGATYGTTANVPTARQEEFEALCLKLRPAHLWIGLVINYT